MYCKVLKSLRGRMSIVILSFLIVISSSVFAFAYDINEKLTIDGTLTGVYQYGNYDVKGLDNKDGGTVILDLGFNYHPTETDEFQITASFAGGNGLDNGNPFSLTTYADDLEDGLKNINGRDRDYLLEAWYKHTFKFDEKISLALTGGIIDSTRYIDDNAFANCETSQFMNQIFVNHKNINLPSYDIGGAIEFNISNFSIRSVVMNSKFEDDEGSLNNYNYYALQIGYALETPVGTGNYRIYGFSTSKRFDDWDGSKKERLQGIGISADQQISSIVGVFVRAGWQDDAAVIDHQNAYSAGVNINGKLWGREKDEIGLGYAYLTGADDSDIDKTSAFEGYFKLQISKYNDISFDLQYIDDNLKQEHDRSGFVYGVRLNAYF